MIREKYVNISELDTYNQRGHNLTRNLVSRECVIPKSAAQDTTLS